METQRRRNASGSSFSALLVMMTMGRSCAATSSPVSITVEPHPVQFVEKVIRKLKVSFVNFVDQEHHALVRRYPCPMRPWMYSRISRTSWSPNRLSYNRCTVS